MLLNDCPEMIGLRIDADTFVAEQMPVMERVSTDSRTISKRAIYVALVGERFDGHQFVDQAIENGACAIVVLKSWLSKHGGAKAYLDQDVTVFAVDDTLLALADLASFQRDQFVGDVVAITGSAGKTTTKEILASILSIKGPVHFTQGNLNNHIGVPLTLFGLSPDDSSAVIELGASAQGEIAYTSALVRPSVAVITNASESHLSGFGSLETIIKTKGEILSYVEDGGVAVLNANDSAFDSWAAMAKSRGLRVLSVGSDSTCDIYADHIRLDQAGSDFTLNYQGQAVACHLPLLGGHNITNALLAGAAALALGVTLAQIVVGFEHCHSAKGRLAILDGALGQRIFDDSYNASPASVLAAIDVLALSPRSWLVLGDMSELGDEIGHWHVRIGQYAANKDIDRLLTCGVVSEQSALSFGEGAKHFDSKLALIEYLNSHTGQGDSILVKGSRSAGMDTVVSALVK